MPTNRKALVFETTSNSYVAEAQPLGEGGAGRVYRVTNEDGQPYALKLLRKGSRTQRQRFKNEIAFCSKNSCSSIVSVLDHGFVQSGNDKCPFYVMPLYAGTLRLLMANGLAHGAVLPLFAQILDGVEAAHLQGIVHRDLKPENVLYDPSSQKLVIADFGVAHFTEEALLTAVETGPQERLANFIYAAPEQRVRGRKSTNRADIYALGLILNEMFTGEVIQGTGHRRIGSVEQELAYLDELVERMVRQSPDERLSSIEEIKRDLIARKNDFVTQQRLSHLKGTVVPEAAVENPIADDPIRVTGVDYSDGGFLVFELNRDPPAEWVQAFRSPGAYAGVMGYEPVKFGFSGASASISMRRNDSGLMQMVSNHFKNYVQSTNEKYSRDLEYAQRRKIEDEKKRLREEIRRTEELQRMRAAAKSIKI